MRISVGLRVRTALGLGLGLGLRLGLGLGHLVRLLRGLEERDAPWGRTLCLTLTLSLTLTLTQTQTLTLTLTLTWYVFSAVWKSAMPPSLFSTPKVAMPWLGG